MSSGTVAPTGDTRGDPTAGPPPPGRWWPPSRRILLVAAVVVVVAAVAGPLWAWRHISVFHDAGGWGFRGVQRPTDSPLYVGMTSELRGAHGTITIRSVDAIVEQDSAGAAISFFVCTVDPSSGVGSIGVVHERAVHQECSRLVPAEGATLRLNHHPREQLVMALQLRHRGTLHVRAADLAYARGWQRGHQQVGGDAVLRRPAGTTRKAAR